MKTVALWCLSLFCVAGLAGCEKIAADMAGAEAKAEKAAGQAVKDEAIVTSFIQPCVTTKQEPYKDGYRNVPTGTGFQHVEKTWRPGMGSSAENRPTTHCLPCTKKDKTPGEQFSCDGGNEPSAKG